MSVSIADIAAAASVSKSTVSRAFARPDAVNDETRQRIFAVAEELGYAPHASGVAPGRVHSIALFVPDIVNPFYPPLIKAVQVAGRKMGLSLVVVGGDDDPMTDYREVRRAAPDVGGMLVFGPRLTDEELQVINRQTPLVLLNHESPGLPSVILWSKDGVRQGVQHLAALGHRRLAFVSAREDNYSNNLRRQAVLEAAEELDCDVEVVGPAEPTYLAGVLAGDLVLATTATAVIAYNDLMAFGCLNRLLDRGIEVGKDISLVSFDDIWLASASRPGLTTVRAPFDAAGTVAVRILSDLMAGTPVSTDPFRLPGELVVRGSTGPAPTGQRRSEPARS